jgi:hypothetical protein
VPSFLRRKTDTTYMFLTHVHGVRVSYYLGLLEFRNDELILLSIPAHRALITRKLKGLEDIISFNSVHWHMGEQGT